MRITPSSKRTIIIHAGMHKTASTYIQQRLRKNKEILLKNGWLYPSLRREHTYLLKRTIAEDFEPWEHLLKTAQEKNCNLLISHEAFSRLLYQPITKQLNEEEKARGAWLTEQINKQNWNIKLIAFIRDQPSYLNSRYTQLTKRLKLSASFKKYVKRTMEQNTISECNLMTLFGWTRKTPNLESIMIPYSHNTSINFLSQATNIDPFEKIIQFIGLSNHQILIPLKTKKPNQQPGKIGTFLAKSIKSSLRKRKGKITDKEIEIARKTIEKMSKKNDWSKDPFIGLTKEIRKSIENHYYKSNLEFCNIFWPGSKWEEIFITEIYPIPSKLDAQEKSMILQVADKLLKRYRKTNKH